MNITIAGELPLLEELAAVVVDSGHNLDAYLVEDLLSADEGGFILESVSSAEVVIEVLNESMAAKKRLLKTLDKVISREAMVLTSALPTSATQAAAWIQSPERVIGIGLVPPVKSGDTVEVAYPLQASEEMSKSALEFWGSVALNLSSSLIALD